MSANKREQVADWLKVQELDAPTWDEFDDAILGLSVHAPGRPPHVLIQLDDAGDVLERFAELRYLLENVGILVDSSDTPATPMLQGSIGFVRTPAAKTTAFLEVWNVDDSHLAPELLAWLDQEIARLA